MTHILISFALGVCCVHTCFHLFKIYARCSLYCSCYFFIYHMVLLAKISVPNASPKVYMKMKIKIRSGFPFFTKLHVFQGGI